MRRPTSLAAAIVLLSLVTPGFAQQAQQNACQAALQQVAQADNQITLNRQNAEQQLTTNHANALLDCQKQAAGGGANAATQLGDCENQVNTAYSQADLSLQQAANTAYGVEAEIANDLRSGPSCSWSAEQITQMVSQLSQAAAQLTTSAAQIISAAKGKGTTAPTNSAGGSGSTRPPTTTPTAPTQPAKPPANGNPPQP
jgi:hypothetical protein